MNTIKTHAPTAARLLLGLIFAVFGLNGFLSFLHMPPPPPAAGAFFGALLATGYMLPLVMSIQLFAGVLLLTGRMVPFALTLLAPIVVNIVAFHLFLAPAGLPMAMLVLVLGLYLAWVNREVYRPLFQGRSTTPRSQPREHMDLRAA